jgi:uncharacterized protein (TIRG00374 family)
MRKSSPAETTAPADAGSLRLALPALAGAAAAYLVWHWATHAEPVPPRFVVAAVPVYLALWLATVALHAMRWRMVLRRLGADPPLARLARLWLAGRAIGSLVPSGTLGGEPVRAHLLTTDGVPARNAAGSVALDRSLELTGNTIVAPLCVGGAVALGGGSTAAMATAALGASVGFGCFAWIYVRALRGRPALVPLARRPLRFLPRGWRTRGEEHTARADAAFRDLVAAHPTLVPAGVGVSLAIELLHLVEMTALFAVFGVTVPLPLLLLSSLGMGIAHAVPVTAALGALEATQVGLFTVSGASLATGVTVAVALRMAETLAILAGLACLATATAGRVRLPGRA